MIESCSYPELLSGSSYPSYESGNNPLVSSVVEQMTSCLKNKPMPKPRFQMKERVKREHILLVEDSPIMMRFYKQMLENSAFSVSTASEENSAMNSAVIKIPRLILIDDAGQSQKTIKIARKLRSNKLTKTIPILIMLPIDTFRELRKKIAPYVDMCIPKTYTLSVLTPSLQSLLSS